ncbi:MAG: acetylxylan esterase [Bacteroidales bacterium]|nr:acetylxylan esterase [Bacteroidales bacterium]
MLPTPLPVSRRDLFTIMGATALSSAVSAQSANPANSVKSAKPVKLEPLNRFPRLVHEYFVAQVRAAEEQGKARRAALKTAADAERYVADVRQRIATCFGSFPPKTPLHPRITGKLDRDGYTVEKVIFESRPGFPVTANLYLPKDRKKPCPGVVGSCGHSHNGKAEKAYQSFCQGLVRQGYVVLIFDPIGQGERLQYTHVEKDHRPRVGVGEHLYAGNQQFLVGEFFGAWRAWDGIRALDYLLTRPEVDPKQVGITGNSGGGTMTTWLTGVENRWAMSAPSCFVTTFRRNLENELPADTEQCPPRALALGLDHADFLAALAPKPVIILAKEKDFFDVRGSEEAYARLRHLYKLLGHEENVGLFTGPTGHGYSQENREAMYRWFNHVTKISDAQVEPALQLEPDESLWCTPKGQIGETGAKTVFTFTREKSESLRKQRQPLTGQPLATAIQKALRLPERSGVPDYRILRPLSNRSYPQKSATTYAIESEPNMLVPVIRLSPESHLSRPPRVSSPAILYVSHHSADAELREDPWLAEQFRAEPEATVYACDVRGIGDSRPETCGTKTFLTPYGCDYFYAIHAIMLDRPYPGQKTFDLLRVLDWLAGQGHNSVHLIARGWGTIPATFAAVLAPTVQRVTLKNALTAFADVAESETYNWPLSSFVPNILASCDLPDCYAALQAKKLTQVEPWNALGATL